MVNLNFDVHSMECDKSDVIGFYGQFLWVFFVACLWFWVIRGERTKSREAEIS